MPRASSSAGSRPRSRTCCAASTSRSGRPNVDVGDHVIVINATKLDISLRKCEDKLYYRHSGYPGGIRSENLGELMERAPGAGREARGARACSRRAGSAGRRSRSCGSTPARPTRTAQLPQPHPLPRGLVLDLPRGTASLSKPLIQTTGRRKEAVARVRLRPGTGKLVVNGQRDRAVLPHRHAPHGRDRGAAHHPDRRRLRRRRHDPRRRHQRPGRRARRSASPGRSSRSTPRRGRR